MFDISVVYVLSSMSNHISETSENGEANNSSYSDVEDIENRKKRTDIFLGEDEAYDDEENVTAEVDRLDKNRSKEVTRFFPNLLPLCPNAIDPNELIWQKRPTRQPKILTQEEKRGSRFIHFTPSTTPLEMFSELWKEPAEVLLVGINQRSKELFEQGKRKKPEQYTKEDLLAFAAAWLFMDCTPLRQRRYFWRKYRYVIHCYSAG